MITSIETTGGKGNAPIYQLKVVLLGTKPPVWRRLQVPGDASLDWLHAVLQVAIGWTNSHLHQFEIKGVMYGDPDLLEDMDGVEFESRPARYRMKSRLAEKHRQSCRTKSVNISVRTVSFPSRSRARYSSRSSGNAASLKRSSRIAPTRGNPARSSCVARLLSLSRVPASGDAIA